MTLSIGMLKPWGRVMLLLALVLCFGRCGSSDDGDGNTPFTAVFLDSQTASLDAQGYANDPRVVLTGKTGTPYTITITEGGSWCWTSRKQATTRTGTLAASKSFVYLYLSENITGSVRRATLTVAFGTGEEFSLTLDQDPYTVPAAFDREWAELPAYVNGDNYLYTTHFAPITSTKTARNYTVCFDKTLRIARWVAYPLHKCYMQGGYKRLDAWAYDPDIPSQYQADLTRGSYKNSSVYGIRGHQCMSYHRWATSSTEMNEQTYYSSNIMPQNSAFNGGSWNDMEDIASDHGRKCSDTLYLVTGNYGQRGWAQDKSGTQVAIPEYCWKVLLRTRSGNTKKRIDQIHDASELMAIAFWAENSSASAKELRQYITSVADVEQMTGYKFFTMIDPAIAAEVKAQNNPAEWGIK